MCFSFTFERGNVFLKLLRHYETQPEYVFKDNFLFPWFLSRRMCGWTRGGATDISVSSCSLVRSGEGRAAPCWLSPNIPCCKTRRGITLTICLFKEGFFPLKQQQQQKSLCIFGYIALTITSHRAAQESHCCEIKCSHISAWSSVAFALSTHPLKMGKRTTDALCIMYVT